MRRIAIGDIHGCSKTFEKLLEDKIQIQKTDNIYLLGDYIDRGPNSKGVIDKILNLIEEGYHIFPIMGNHEYMLTQSVNTYQDFIQWLYNGAKITLESFGIESLYNLPEKYWDFFNKLPYYYILDDFILVHAGLNFNIEKPLEDRQAMLWIREDYVNIEKIGNRRLVVGHTPSTIEKIRKSLNTDKIYLDGGCVYWKKYPDVGNLCALELDTMELIVQQNIDFI